MARTNEPSMCSGARRRESEEVGGAAREKERLGKEWEGEPEIPEVDEARIRRAKA